MNAISSSSWITFDLIENLIQTIKEDNRFKLKTFNVHDADGKAENFCSNIVGVSATFYHDSDNSIEQTQNFIVKSSIEVDDFDSLNNEVAYLPKETIVYKKILPAVEKLLLSIGDKTRIAPRYALRFFQQAFAVLNVPIFDFGQMLFLRRKTKPFDIREFDEWWIQNN